VGEFIDLKKSTISLKADEQMIAFAGFVIWPEPGQPEKEGVLKISAFYRPNGNDYLTLTFIVDTEKDEAAKDKFDKLFESVQEESIKPYLGQEMKTMVKVPLGFIAKTTHLFMEELNIYISSLKSRERNIVEKQLIPALGNVLPCTFDSVEWWTGDLATQKTYLLQDRSTFPDHLSIKDYFRKWFSSE
jgi:hypothetical protein